MQKHVNLITSCTSRSRRELSNEYLVAKFGFDIAENATCKVCQTRQLDTAYKLLDTRVVELDHTKVSAT